MASNQSFLSTGMLSQKVLDSSEVTSRTASVAGVGSVGLTMISALTTQIQEALGRSGAIDEALALVSPEERQDIRRYLKRNADVAEAIPRIARMVESYFPGSTPLLEKRKDATIRTYNPIILRFETPEYQDLSDQAFLQQEDQFRDAMWQLFEDRLSSRIQILVL